MAARRKAGEETAKRRKWERNDLLERGRQAARGDGEAPGERGRSETGHAKTRQGRGERQAGNSRRRIQAAIFLPSFPQLPLPPGKEGRGASGARSAARVLRAGRSEGPRLSAGVRQGKPNKKEERKEGKKKGLGSAAGRA